MENVIAIEPGESEFLFELYTLQNRDSNFEYCKIARDCKVVTCSCRWLLVIQDVANESRWLQLIAAHCNSLQVTAAHCNTLQLTASDCCSLQVTAAHCRWLLLTAGDCSSSLQLSTTYCRGKQVNIPFKNRAHLFINCNTDKLWIKIQTKCRWKYRQSPN